MKNKIALSACAALALVAGAAYAETTSTALPMTPKPVTLTVVGATQGDVVATDAGTVASKRGQIVRLAAGGQTMYVLVRVEQAANGIFIDGIAAASTTDLATAISAFDLTGISHPSPTNDTVDDALSTAMVGYTGS